eukprot:symbB.v1.2.031844.t1/scaffold3742.1/size51101/2
MASRLRTPLTIAIPPPRWQLASVVLVPSLPCEAQEAGSESSGPDVTLVLLLLVAALLWVTMLSSIALQIGGAEPGVESTYWWMGDDAKQKAKKGASTKARALD